MYIIVKLRSRSRSGEGQVRVRKVKETKDLDLRYTIFLVFTTHHKLFSWLLRGLDMSDGTRMGWYDSSRVRGGQDFQVDSKSEIKWHYRGTPRSTSGRASMSQVWPKVVTV